mmetsp:Transcript_34129/g.59556  ORF Transcript_34129/g.59556 Transcript_34129/m.59556 type:complete len:175 (+) Transcript_34129:1647-2171(+)
MKRVLSQRRYSEALPSSRCFSCEDEIPPKMLPTFILNDSSYTESKTDRYDQNREPPKRPVSSLIKKAVNKSRESLYTARSQLKENGKSVSRSPIKTTKPVHSKKKSTGASSSISLKARLSKVPNLHLEIEKVLVLLSAHLSRCPALTQEYKKIGGSRLMREYEASRSGQSVDYY